MLKCILHFPWFIALIMGYLSDLFQACGILLCVSEVFFTMTKSDTKMVRQSFSDVCVFHSAAAMLLTRFACACLYVRVYSAALRQWSLLSLFLP